MLLDLSHHLGTTVCGNGFRLHCPVALDEAEDNHFASSAPAALALAMPTECGLVAFDGSDKGFTQLLFVSAAGADLTIKSFLGRATGIVTKSLSINRNAKGKKFNEAALGRFRKTT